jgi:choline dehydrogenase-like flavoprotein
VFVDARGLHNGGELRFDVCVVGAGAAGIALALKLRGSGARVVVLESGGETWDADTQEMYVGETTGQPYFDLTIDRLRFFGGSTNHWGGTCRPFSATDFDPPPGGAVPGWPIGLADVAPFYDEAGVVCGLRRPVSKLDEAAAQDPTKPLPLGADDFDARYNQIVDRQRRSFADRYRDDISAADDITVHLWANATEIMVDSSGTKVTGAQVATLTGVRYIVQASVVVLATGGIENPRLLLASKGAGPEGLGNRHDLVGRFFMEHPRFLAALIVPSDPGMSYEWYDSHIVDGIRFRGYSALSQGRKRDDELTDVQLRLSPRYSPAFTSAIGSRDAQAFRDLADWVTDGDRPALGRDLLRISADLTTAGDWVVPGGPVPVPLPDVLSRLVGGTSSEREALIPGLFGDVAAYLWANGVSQPPVDVVEVTARIAQVPNPDSRVTLTESADQLGIPRVKLHWELSENDRRSVVRAVELFGAELAATGAGRAQLLFDETGNWPLDLSGGSHHMGTTRMSTEPEDGVVDANCMVHGVESLYVAGSSVFATASSATPTLTLVALALRLGDHLTREIL